MTSALKGRLTSTRPRDGRSVIKLFSRRSAPKERAPSLTIFERRSLELPGPVSGELPESALLQMEGDSMIQTALRIKRLGVIAAPYRLEANGARAEVLAFVEQNFQRMQGSPLTLVEGALHAFTHGWSIQEKRYEVADGRVWLRAVRRKNPHRFGIRLDAFGKLEGVRLEVPGEAPVELDPEGFVVYRYQASHGREKGRGDLHAAYPHWRSKQTLQQAWNAYQQRLGIPTVYGTVASTLSNEERQGLLAWLDRLHEQKSAVLPEEIRLDVLKGDRDTANGFLEAIEFHNREIARAILGQTLTTDEGRRVGSLALGRVHLQVLLLQLEAIRQEVADSVMTEQVIRPLVELNFGQVAFPRFVFESADLGAFVGGFG